MGLIFVENILLKLQVIVVSTRPGRKGEAVGNWFYEQAVNHGGFETELIDLSELDLPMFDEANHPRLQNYENPHTLEWAQIVERGDAYVFVTPEYNYGAPPSLINALDYLSREWAYKAAAFVSYGGVSAGTRGVEMSKQILTTLSVMPIPRAVSLPFFAQYFDEAGLFVPGENQNKAAAEMLDELGRWAAALKPLRA